MEPIQNPSADKTAISTPVLKSCPYCGGKATVTTASKPLRYGVVCRDCPVEIWPVLLTQELAIRVWNRRSGTASSFGGRATKGLLTRKKRRACRRNLKKAREAKKLKRIIAECEAIYWRIKPFRDQELAELEAEAARGRAELMILESLIHQFPDLSEYLDWLKDRWERAEGDGHRQAAQLIHNATPEMLVQFRQRVEAGQLDSNTPRMLAALTKDAEVAADAASALKGRAS